MAPRWSEPTPMAPISGTGPSGSSLSRQQVCRLHLSPHNLATRQGVYEIQIAASNTNILYMMYDGDVFKSNNKGTTWTQTNFAQVTSEPKCWRKRLWRKNGHRSEQSQHRLCRHAQTVCSSQRMAARPGQSVSAVPVGLSNVNSSGNYPSISGILFDPGYWRCRRRKNQTIFASSYGNGVYESTNGGTTWTLLSGGPTVVEMLPFPAPALTMRLTAVTLWRYANGAWTELH